MNNIFTKQIFVFHAFHDPGHGWIKVNRNLINMLGLANHITSYSYQRGDNVYLFEDCDACEFLHALKKQGGDFVLKHHYTNNLSRIRSYDRYQAAA